jgi:hypothetical protein
LNRGVEVAELQRSVPGGEAWNSHALMRASHECRHAPNAFAAAICFVGWRSRAA